MAMKLTEEQKSLAIGMAIDGETLKRIAEALCLSPKQFWQARQDDPSFQNAFALARQEGIHGMVDRLDTIHNDIDDVQRARLASENIRWKASKLNPTTYGDRLDVNLNQTVDLGSALQAAKDRARLAERDVTPTPIQETPTKSKA